MRRFRVAIIFGGIGLVLLLASAVLYWFSEREQEDPTGLDRYLNLYCLPQRTIATIMEAGGATISIRTNDSTNGEKAEDWKRIAEFWDAREAPYEMQLHLDAHRRYLHFVADYYAGRPPDEVDEMSDTDAGIRASELRNEAGRALYARADDRVWDAIVHHRCLPEDITERLRQDLKG